MNKDTKNIYIYMNRQQINQGLKNSTTNLLRVYEYYYLKVIIFKS